MNEDLELYLLLRRIYEGSKINKRLKSVKYTKKTIEHYSSYLLPFKNYEKKFIALLAIFVTYKYSASNFETFLNYCHNNLKDRSEYYKFKDVMKNPLKYIQADIEFLMENNLKIEVDEVFQLFQEGKISFYTVYFLLKNKKLNTFQKIIYDKIDYLMKFMKWKLDEKIFKNIIIEDGSLF